jgi:hypothetical protein
MKNALFWGKNSCFEFAALMWANHRNFSYTWVECKIVTIYVACSKSIWMEIVVDHRMGCVCNQS